MEKTDHSHLGQIITYAAGLQATSVIWVAREFTEEHRAALDWLNEHTSKHLRFFGLTIELWRIGDSVPAPRLHVVARPNDWSKLVATTKGVSVGQSFKRKYWTSFKEKIEESPGPLNARAPQDGNWVNFAIGRSNVMVEAVINPSRRWIRAGIYLAGPLANSRFQQLIRHKDVIEHQSGPLDWQELPARQDCRVTLIKYETDPRDESDWSNQHEWMREKVKAFHVAFSPFVRKLKDNAAPSPLSATASGTEFQEAQESDNLSELA